MRTRFAALCCLLSVSTLALTGCVAGLTYDRSTAAQPASFLFTMADVSVSPVTGVTSSYPAGSTGASVAATSSASVTSGYLGYGIRGDGKGNIYALGYSSGGSLSVNVYSTANGVLTLTRSFTYGAFPQTLAADPTGIVYVSTGSAILKFAANATGAATPTIIAPTSAFTPMATDSAGDLYAYAGSGVVDEFNAGFTTGTPSKVLTLSAIGSTAISSVSDMAIDSSGNIYLAGFATGPTPFISEYSSATGTTTPTKTISGSSTLMADPVALAVDNAGNIYEEDAPIFTVSAHNNIIYTFSAGASGNVAPSGNFSPAAQTVAPATFVGLVAY
jgi:hypothetical protein